ncbi:MAG: threonine synthase [archaeon]
MNSTVKEVYCFKCKMSFDFNDNLFYCPNCGYSLDIKYDYKKIKEIISNDRHFKTHLISHWKYWPFYPLHDFKKKVSLGEGCTPLIQSSHSKNLMLKFEACNPTGSFKDRGSAIEVSRARELKARKLVCATTGNMGASIAFYANKAVIPAVIFVPSFTPKTKLEQIKASGARIVKVKGNYDKALKKSIVFAKKHNCYLTGDYPLRGEGQKSVGFEICDQLNWSVPENIVLPIGNGTLCFAVFKAFQELKLVGLTNRMPKVIGVQSSECMPVTRSFERKSKEIILSRKEEKAGTIATAINCNLPVDGLEALFALRESKGFGLSVTDKQVLGARKLLAEKEGLFAEPSGAVSFAGYLKVKRKLKGKTVCVVTGHGLKQLTIS